MDLTFFLFVKIILEKSVIYDIMESVIDCICWDKEGQK